MSTTSGTGGCGLKPEGHRESSALDHPIRIRGNSSRGELLLLRLESVRSQRDAKLLTGATEEMLRSKHLLAEARNTENLSSKKAAKLNSPDIPLRKASKNDNSRKIS